MRRETDVIGTIMVVLFLLLTFCCPRKRDTARNASPTSAKVVKNSFRGTLNARFAFYSSLYARNKLHIFVLLENSGAFGSACF